MDMQTFRSLVAEWWNKKDAAARTRAMRGVFGTKHRIAAAQLRPFSRLASCDRQTVQDAYQMSQSADPYYRERVA